MADKQLASVFSGEVDKVFAQLLSEYVLKTARKKFEAALAANASALDAEIDVAIAAIMASKLTSVTEDVV